MITILTKQPTIKDAKNQLSRLIHELDKYDENMECHLYLYDTNGVEYENPNGFAKFVLEPVICEFDYDGNPTVIDDVNSAVNHTVTKTVRVDIAGYL